MMKKYLYLALFSAAVLTSCQKENYVGSIDSPEGFTLIGYSGLQTKTSFGTPDGPYIPFLWSVGDKITLKDGTASEPLTEAGESAKFTFNSGSVSPGDTVYYNRDTEGTAGYKVNNVQNGNLGESGDYGEGVIAPDGKSFTLQHKTSYLWLNPKASANIESKVVRVDIESDSVIAGNGTTQYKNITVNIPDDKELMIGTSAPNGIWLAVVIAPTTITNFSIIYHFADGTKAISNFNQELNFEPGKTIRISHTISDIIRTLSFEYGSEGPDFQSNIGETSYENLE